MQREGLELEDIVAIEANRLQTMREQAEKNGAQPEPLPTEEEMKKIVMKIMDRKIMQWSQGQFDEFGASLRKK